MFIDTHAHIYGEEFETDLPKMLQRATDEGVEAIYMPNIDSSSVEPMLRIAERYPFCFPMMGLHPCYVKENWKDELLLVERYLSQQSFTAVGEIGIDLYWDTSFSAEQERVFRAQLSMARDCRLPVAIHSRESLDLTIAIVDEMQDGRLSGVFHCYNGSVEQGRRATGLGFYLGVGGVITYKNAGMASVFSELGPDWLVLETDAPYLAPVPYRGKRNECGYLSHIAARLSEALDCTVPDIAGKTSRNARQLFGASQNPSKGEESLE